MADAGDVPPAGVGAEDRIQAEAQAARHVGRHQISVRGECAGARLLRRSAAIGSLSCREVPCAISVQRWMLTTRSAERARRMPDFAQIGTPHDDADGHAERQGRPRLVTFVRSKSPDGA